MGDDARDDDDARFCAIATASSRGDGSHARWRDRVGFGCGYRAYVMATMAGMIARAMITRVGGWIEREAMSPRRRSRAMRAPGDADEVCLSFFYLSPHRSKAVYAPKMTRTRRVNNRTLVVRAGAGETDGNVKFANNKAEFEAVSATAGAGLVAVQISTKTCGPCKVIYPTFVGLSNELPKVTFVKIMGDTDLESRALMKEWGVRVVPLFFLFRNGEKVGEWSGAKADVLRENVLAACNADEK